LLYVFAGTLGKLNFLLVVLRKSKDLGEGFFAIQTFVIVNWHGRNLWFRGSNAGALNVTPARWGFFDDILKILQTCIASQQLWIY
jgi:hypothetical protein